MKYAIFDLDGTLLDSMWIWESLDLELLARYNAVPTPEMRERIKTLSVRQACDLFIREYALDASPDDMILEVGCIGEARYIHDVTAKPTVPETLEWLKNRHVRMCIATASVRRNVMAVLERLRMLDYFEFIITADDLNSGKDSPEIYLRCAERFGADPSGIWVFEDALHAAKTAKGAGFYVAGVYDASSAADSQAIKEISDIYLIQLGDLEGLL